jgi:hypothetical protein
VSYNGSISGSNPLGRGSNPRMGAKVKTQGGDGACKAPYERSSRSFTSNVARSYNEVHHPLKVEGRSSSLLRATKWLGEGRPEANASLGRHPQSRTVHSYNGHYSSLSMKRWEFNSPMNRHFTD